MEPTIKEDTTQDEEDPDCVMLLLRTSTRQIADHLMDICNTIVTDELARDKERHEN
jgi:hypothetical protein